MSDEQQQELFAKLLDGSLTPSEWAEAQTRWGDESLRKMLAGEQRLREAYRRMSQEATSPDMVSIVMNRVAGSPAPNRTLLWVLKYGGLVGLAIFVMGLTATCAFFYTSGSVSFTFTVPVQDGYGSLWGLPILVLIGVGIWRMETA
ncbi:MAG: hypothetical protein NTX15_03385 [Candidatus Kapabacteria bacterium]|nr:hypothetical protein [Candidatus Kapabacteria bacterium]